MKFNVELNKKEMQTFLDKPTEWQIAGKRFNKGIIKIGQILKNMLKNIQKSNKLKVFIVIFLGLIILSTSTSLIKSYGKIRYSEGWYDGIDYAKYIYKEDITNTLENRSLQDVSSWFAKKFLLTIGNNLYVLFFIIGAAWLLHGVGFKII